MVVCRFFLQGNCKFGQNCRNEHPSSGGGGGGGGGGGQNQNRFGALSGNNAGGGSNRFGNAANTGTDAGAMTREIPADLDGTKVRPKWIFSSYAPLKSNPASLMADNEFSPEEIRLRYYLAASAGLGSQADQEATQMFNKIEQDYKNILNNVNDVPKFMNEAEKKRPNRHDFANVQLFDGRKSRDEFVNGFNGNQSNAFGSGQSPFGAGNANSSAFGQAQNTNPNPFSKPATSTFGQASGGCSFGKPAFGQSGFGGANSGSGFGQAAAPAFGQSPTPAFGQSSFGKPAISGAGAAFGKPSLGSFGQNAQQSPFGAASATGGFGQAASTFGQPAQPAAFGQPSQPTSAFGQPAQPTSTFGQPSQPSSAFGQAQQPQSTFGQPSQPTAGFGQNAQTTSAFGQQSQANNQFGQPSMQSAFGQPAQTTSAFGQTSTPSSGLSTAFGQQAQPATNGFGATAPGTGFGQNGSAFGQHVATAANQNAVTSPPASANPFGPGASVHGSVPNSAVLPPSQPDQESLSPPNPLTGRPSAPLHVSQSLPPVPPQIDDGKRLVAYRGQRTRYVAQPDKSIDARPVKQEPILCYTRPDTRAPEKIWHPTAGNDPVLLLLSKDLKKFDLQVADEGYTAEVVDEYRHLYETGGFRGGKVPLVPPKREWVAYDF